MAEQKVGDLYGFEIKVTAAQQAQRQECDAAADKEQAAWRQYIEKDKMPPDAKLKDFVRKGVPPTLRTWVWMQSSGAAKCKEAMVRAGQSNYFQNMVRAGQTSSFMKDIDKDIAHTFPNHSWLQSEEGQSALRRVLSAYSVHNEKVGYCRSMNNIVGMLLVAMNRNEDSAFWLLAALVEDILHPGTYSQNLEGCQVEMKALDELLQTKLPRLHAHLAALEADVSILATDWYLGLFTTSMPSEAVARVFDALFNEGPKILFRTSLALLKLQEEACLKADNAGDVFVTVRQAAASMHNRDKLMSTAFDGIGSLPMAVIEKYREERAGEVAAAVRERNALKRRQDLKDTLDNVQQQQQQEDEDLQKQTGELNIKDELNAVGQKATEVGQKAAAGLKKGFGNMMVGLSNLKDKTVTAMNKPAEGQARGA